MPSIELIRKIDALDPSLKDVLYTFIEEIEKSREQAVSKTEFNELKDIVKNLGIKVGDLTITVKELAEAQSKTEKSLQKLIKDHEVTRKQLGGLDKNVGFHLENTGYKALPALLKKDYGLIVEELKRDFLKNRKGEDVEVNILGKASRDGKDYLIIGEAKCHLSHNDIKHFIKSRIKGFEGLYKEEIFPLLITHMVTSPGVRDYAEEKGVALYYSYQF